MRLAHWLRGQKSRSRGGGILWRPPSRTACFQLHSTSFSLSLFGALPYQAGPDLQWCQSSLSWALFFICSYFTSLLFIQSIIISLCLPRVLVPDILPSNTVCRRDSLLNTWPNQFVCLCRRVFIKLLLTKFGSWVFSYAGPDAWNKVPYDLGGVLSLAFCKQHVKVNQYTDHRVVCNSPLLELFMFPLKGRFMWVAGEWWCGW